MKNHFRPAHGNWNPHSRRLRPATLIAADLASAFARAEVPCPVEVELLVALAAADEVSAANLLRGHRERCRSGKPTGDSARELSRDVGTLAVRRGLAHRLPNGRGLVVGGES